ncbi:MAG: tyrosine-type recombinase/integrase [Thermoguttaceae bacterium]|jgi:integrase
MVRDFHSSLATHIAAFLDEKLACGYRYVAETATLRRFDRFLCQSGYSGEALSRELIERWTAKQPHERPRTHKARLLVIRQLGLYLHRHGIEAYAPDSKLMPMARLEFVPYIFTQEQVRQLLANVDHLPFDPRTPERHVVMPELFRVLYGCGLRAGEVLRLRIADVDLDQGVPTIHQSKFRKDRLVPLRGYKR